MSATNFQDGVSVRGKCFTNHSVRVRFSNAIVIYNLLMS